MVVSGDCVDLMWNDPFLKFLELTGKVYKKYKTKEVQSKTVTAHTVLHTTHEDCVRC